MRVVLMVLAVAVFAMGCRSSQAPAPVPPLAGTSWRAQEIDGSGVLPRVESTLTFDGTTRIAGQAACNRYFGDADIGDGTIRLKPAGTTRMACAPDVMEQEGRFLEALGGAKVFRREGDTLLLVDAGGRVRVRLAPASPSRGEIVPPPGGTATSPAPLVAHAFDCDNGRRFVLARSEDGSAMGEAVDLILSDRRHRLPRVPTASGVRYAGAGVAVWTKGREAILDLDGRVSTCVEDRRRSILEDARARGAELRATGNEPGWVLELLSDQIVFIGDYGAKRVTTARPAKQIGSTRGEETYIAATDAHRMTVRIQPGPCLDSMSGDRHASTVHVELDGKTHRGCGDPLR
jgi:heat shock protein HslJ/uncharacterized membrane protein